MVIGSLIFSVLTIVAVVVVGSLLIRSLTTRRDAEHVLCARCEYTVEFTRSNRCPECGAALPEVGIILPSDGRYRSSGRRYVALVLLVGALPVLIFATLAGQVTEVIVESYRDHPSHNSDNTQSIIAENATSGVLQRLDATVHNVIRDNDVTYTHLELSGELSSGRSLNTLTFPLPDRGFIMNWRESPLSNGRSWSGSVVPDPNSSNESPKILRRDDLPRAEVLAWLDGHGVDTNDSQIVKEIDAFIEYVLGHMVAGGMRMTTVEHFASVRRDSSATLISKTHPAKIVTSWAAGGLGVLLLVLASRRRTKQIVDARKRNAEIWLADLSESGDVPSQQ